MSPVEAAWVREHVWPAGLRAIEAARPGWHGMCPCQHGICGACDPDRTGGVRHDRCLTRQRGGPIRFWLAALTDGAGMVVGPHLWPAAGQSCRYLCPCPCPKAGPVAQPAREPAAPTGGQLDLFALDAS